MLKYCLEIKYGVFAECSCYAAPSVLPFAQCAPSVDFYGTKEQMPEMKAVALGFESVSDEETRSESSSSLTLTTR